jgi:predicted class III extradiol MEMO1 family dioxygenase
MEHIELHDIEKFTDYLKETENNICGKHVISILLHVICKSYDSASKTVKTVTCLKPSSFDMHNHVW